MFCCSLHSFIVGSIALGAIGNVVNAQAPLPSAPLPSCSSLGISSDSQCETQCINKGSAKLFFEKNGAASECRCHAAKICDDDPTCTDLAMPPGSFKAHCRGHCPTADGARSEASVSFPLHGQNETRIHTACYCDGEERCSDNILFSDRGEGKLPECSSVGINSADSCKNKCAYYSDLFYGHEFKHRNGGKEWVCTCLGAKNRGSPRAPYCADPDIRAILGLDSAGMTVHVATAVIMSFLMSLMI